MRTLLSCVAFFNRQTNLKTHIYSVYTQSRRVLDNDINLDRKYEEPPQEM